uniref:Uncharacterized protein n=1 Tax=mine drainage metagenome TaxID=410659 RepID=E6PHX7_9ZZZZ
MTLTRFIDQSELWKIGALSLTRFIDQYELWKIGALGSILPTAQIVSRGVVYEPRLGEVGISR